MGMGLWKILVRGTIRLNWNWICQFRKIQVFEFKFPDGADHKKDQYLETALAQFTGIHILKVK